eukprot:TRINITY_DN2888_c0_g1_i1.p1 TRINITY_DN2888_c0_g1~~TRINITY_DN2888_c0_g1_i1.p1  ORF type:complete len:753 (+),score=93.92 TRINITY_DN2888_c0_g1_i1:124-2382(+)
MASRDAVTVAVRLRPLLDHEAGQLPCWAISGNEVELLPDNIPDATEVEDPGPWTFDFAMDSSDPQSPAFVDNNRCYELVGRPLVDQIFSGYNACMFCYGQTGTGKTATMMGYPELGKGILPRVIGEIVERAENVRADGDTVSLTASMLEVHNERINDLLKDRDKWEGTKIKTRLIPTGVIIAGATEVQIKSEEDGVQLIRDGDSRRTVAKTKMNPTSSRGHTVFKLELAIDSDGQKKSSELYLADLAGHENIKTTAVKGPQLVELTHINSSLMHLQRVITALAKKGGQTKGKFAEYRNSELTLLLLNGLAVNSRPSAIVTMSPAVGHLDTTWGSIQFALELKGIAIQVSANVSSDPAIVMKAMKEELKRLKDELAAYQRGDIVPEGFVLASAANGYPAVDAAGRGSKGSPEKRGSVSSQRSGADIDGDGSSTVSETTSKEKQIVSGVRARQTKYQRGKTLDVVMTAMTMKKHVKPPASQAVDDIDPLDPNDIGDISGATLALIEKAKLSLASIAARRISYYVPQAKRSEDDRHEKPWIATENEEALLELDEIMHWLLPVPMAGIHLHEGPQPTPKQAALALKRGVNTLVLAGGECGMKNLQWCQSFLISVLQGYPTTALYIMQAVRGGPDELCQIRFIEETMNLMGFQSDVLRKDYGRYMKWGWRMSRPLPALAYLVRLYMYKNMDVMNQGLDFAIDLSVEKAFSTAPNLKRTCIVSCPLADEKGRPVYDELLKKMHEGLDMAIATAELKDW